MLMNAIMISCNYAIGLRFETMSSVYNTVPHRYEKKANTGIHS